VLIWRDEAHTQKAAERLSACPAIGNAFIELHGELGAGKTTFVRHLLRALGVQGRIKSPTYAVVEPHVGVFQGQPLAISHFDFYRFNDPREFEDAGFREVFAAPGLKLAEWAEKLRSDTNFEKKGPVAGVPACDLALKIVATDESMRRVELAAHTAAGQSLMEFLSE
jgi:tRNA threonylcarbamoyladenosine biosynthesis protein TsaE